MREKDFLLMSTAVSARCPDHLVLVETQSRCGISMPQSRHASSSPTLDVAAMKIGRPPAGRLRAI